MKEELASVNENETLLLVNRPTNANVIENCWAMRAKTSYDVKARFKARLVAKAHTKKTRN
jgi:hypothetical protein